MLLRQPIVRRTLRSWVSWLPQKKWGVRLIGPERYVGGDWSGRGNLLVHLLIKNGLSPHHRLLDFGCGAGRATGAISRYLQPGRYTGWDPQTILIDWAKTHLNETINERHIGLHSDFQALGPPFDYLIAHSVFTHLATHDLKQALIRLRSCAHTNSQLIVSYFDGSSATNPTHSHDRWAFLYSKEELAQFALEAGWETRPIQTVPHPRGQTFLKFRAIDTAQ